MLTAVPFPIRVYLPTSGWFGTALSRDSTGILVSFDGDDGAPSKLDPMYVQECSVVQIVSEDKDAGRATLIDGRVVLFGSAQVPPGGSHVT